MPDSSSISERTTVEATKNNDIESTTEADESSVTEVEEPTTEAPTEKITENEDVIVDNGNNDSENVIIE